MGPVPGSIGGSLPGDNLPIETFSQNAWLRLPSNGVKFKIRPEEILHPFPYRQKIPPVRLTKWSQTGDKYKYSLAR
jgi:hypothetical protein